MASISSDRGSSCDRCRTDYEKNPSPESASHAIIGSPILTFFHGFTTPNPMENFSNYPFAGIYTAIVTPFLDNGAIDYEAFACLLERQCQAGVQGIVVGGSTGEGSALEEDERLELLKQAITIVQGRAVVIAGAAHNITRHAVAMQKGVQELPIAGTLQTVPWYNKPTQEGLYRHFKAIAEAATVPIILYNNPARSVVNMAPETVARLAKDCPSIVGIKDAQVDLEHLQKLLGEVRPIRPYFSLLSSEDNATLITLALGGQGAISMIANLVPEKMVGIYRAYCEGNLPLARELSLQVTQLAELMFYRSNPIPIKLALSFQGLIQPNFRAPLCELSPEETRYLQAALNQLT